jgi:hypothetical protein
MVLSLVQLISDTLLMEGLSIPNGALLIRGQEGVRHQHQISGSCPSLTPMA